MSEKIKLQEKLTASGDNFLQLAVDHIHTQDSPLQKIRVSYHPAFGRILSLDDHFQTSQRDEFLYHEAMVHPIMFNDQPERVLIVGGGDGGMLKQVLKHECVKKVTLVELDQMVIDVCQRFIPDIAGESFESGRVEVVIGDGMLHAAQNPGTFDLIILDLPDPEGEVARLTGDLGMCIFHSALTPKGSLVMHTGSIMFQSAQVNQKIELAKKYFNFVTDYSQYVPLYGSEWGMMMCRKSKDYFVSDEEIKKRYSRLNWTVHLKLYNDAYHALLMRKNPMTYWRPL